MSRYSKKQLIGFLALWIGFSSCRPDYSPKPDGYFRIELLPREYVPIRTNLPIVFDISSISHIQVDSTKRGEEWFNIVYPFYRATIYCSYYQVPKGRLSILLDENRDLIYRHKTQADEIVAQAYEDSERDVYATLYSLTGSSATPLQFVVTDSASRLLRGALYFDNKTIGDSIAPVVDYMTEDVICLIDSLHWGK